MKIEKELKLLSRENNNICILRKFIKKSLYESKIQLLSTQTYLIKDTYFDTQDFSLLNTNCSLRIRKPENRIVFKFQPNITKNKELKRQEISAFINDNDEIGSKISEFLDNHKLNVQVSSLFELEIERSKYIVSANDIQFEICLDYCKAHQPPKKTFSFIEIEIEYEVDYVLLSKELTKLINSVCLSGNFYISNENKYSICIKNLKRM